MTLTVSICNAKNFCDVSQLKISSAGITNVGMSKTQTAYAFKNISTENCYLNAVQKVQTLNGKGKEQDIKVVNQSYFENNQDPKQKEVLLKPGMKAYLYINGVSCGVLPKHKKKAKKDLSMISISYDSEVKKLQYMGYKCQLTANKLVVVNDKFNGGIKK